MSYKLHLTNLVGQLDPDKHSDEIRTLQRCRSVRDLAQVAAHDGGWLSPKSTVPRLKLVRHGSGTYLVVAYKDGWSTRVAMEPFPR